MAPGQPPAPKAPARSPLIDRIPWIFRRMFAAVDRRLSSGLSGFILACIGGLIIGLLQLNQVQGVRYDYVEGTVAPNDLRVTRDLLLEDDEATLRRRADTGKAVLPIYDLDPEISFLARDRMLNLMQFLTDSDAGVNNRDITAMVQEKFGLVLTPELVRDLRKIVGDESVSVKLRMLLNKLYENWLVPDKELLRSQHKDGIELRFLQGLDAMDEEDSIVRIAPDQFDKILGIEEASGYLEKQSLVMLKETSRQKRAVLVKLSALSVRPNLIFNRAETDRRAKAAEDSVKPVLIKFSKGEIIVREGERVTADQMHRVQLLRAAMEERFSWRFLVGSMIFAFLAYLLLMLYPVKAIWKTPALTLDRVFIVLSISMVLAAIVLFMPIAEGIHRGFPALTNEIVLLGFPVAAMVMIMRVVYLPRYAIFYALTLSILAGYIVGNPWSMFVYLAGGSVIALRLEHIRRRSMFFAAGFYGGALQAAMGVAIYLARETHSIDTLSVVAGVTFVGGLLSAFVAMALLPLFEWLFNFTTDIKLMELAEDDQPLLRWLHIQAPGTYNHSVNVGRLAEVAAEAIGADALLVKVGAYYHDVGKGFMPQYFVENQKDYNPHEELKPSMSALTIIRHVSQGRELALEHHLPKPMIDFILEHHGTSMVEYFYTKAMDLAGEDDQPDESTFRYPGPRPQTKESGILMLADVVEATSRVLQKPTEANIRGMIHRLTNKIFAEGQLDECPLTLQDLHAIAKSFSIVLTGMLHARVQYPSKIDEQPTRKRKSEDRDSKSDRDRVSGDGGDDGDDSRTSLKRLGIS